MLKNLHPKRLFSFVHFYLLLIFLISIKGWACEIKIFDCAQGNAVVAKYHNQTMVFDAGRKGHAKFVQYICKTEDDSAINKKFVIDPQPKKQVSLQAIRSVKLPKTKTYDTKYYKEEFEDKFKEYATEGVTLKAVFVSHPDVDHYNLIKEFKLKPKVFILGGYYNLYSKSFKNYIIDNKLQKIFRSKNYSNDEDPSEIYKQKWERRNFSFSQNEGNCPQVKILSANVGKKGKRPTNDDSMIIKIIYKGKSIIIPGDAETGNWKVVKDEDIKADYLMLSHHGASTNGSTTLELLNRIKPKACFISAGFVNFHPKMEVIDYLLKYFKEEKYNTTPHFITFFDKTTLQTRFINAPIFSTIDNGILTINLSGDINVEVARNFVPSPDIFFSGEDEAGKQYINQYKSDLSSIYTLKELTELNGNEDSKIKYDKEDNLYEIFNTKTNQNEVYFKHGEIYIKCDLIQNPVDDGKSSDDSHASSDNNDADLEDDDSQRSSENNNSAEEEDDISDSTANENDDASTEDTDSEKSKGKEKE